MRFCACVCDKKKHYFKASIGKDMQRTTPITWLYFLVVTETWGVLKKYPERSWLIHYVVQVMNIQYSYLGKPPNVFYHKKLQLLTYFMYWKELRLCGFMPQEYYVAQISLRRGGKRA